MTGPEDDNPAEGTSENVPTKPSECSENASESLSVHPPEKQDEKSSGCLVESSEGSLENKLASHSENPPEKPSESPAENIPETPVSLSIPENPPANNPKNLLVSHPDNPENHETSSRVPIADPPVTHFETESEKPSGTLEKPSVDSPTNSPQIISENIPEKPSESSENSPEKPSEDENASPIKMRKDKEILIKTPLRKLPMRLAKINTVIITTTTPIRILRTTRSAAIQNNGNNSVNNKSVSQAKAMKKVPKSVAKGKKKDSNSTSTTLATGPTVRRPSLRAARRRIKQKNIKARSSKCQMFFCDKCDKVYDHYSELVYHQRRHTGEKPFACSWPGCTAAFSASNARVRHMRIHTGEKPYLCPYTECGRRFTYWKDLKLHKLRHSGEKPHKCTWPGCSSKFFRRDDLKHHRYTHTGEKPYKCTFPGCESAFTQKSPLNLHMRKIHKVVPGNKVPDKSQPVGQLVNGSLVNNFNQIITNAAPNLCEFPIYPSNSTATVTLMRPPGQTIGGLPVLDHNNISNINNLNDSATNNTNHIFYTNPSQPNEHIECMNAVDKLASILVTCDVSPATVHGVSHQFNQQDVNNSWPGFAFVSDTPNPNQNIQSNQGVTVAGSQMSSCAMKEPNVLTKSAGSSLNQITSIDDLIASACAANDIPMDEPVDKNANTTVTDNTTEAVTQVQISEAIGNQKSQTSVTSTSTSVSTSTSTSTNVKTTPAGTSPSSSPNNANEPMNEAAPKKTAAKLTGSKSSKETVSSASGKGKKSKPSTSKTKEANKSSTNSTSKSPRKRANYRIKAPESNKKTIGVAIVRQKSTKESKTKRLAAKTNQSGAKRTIAIQTTKRQPIEKTKDGKFKCDYCEREFKAKHDRDCHHMTHTGEKPRACDWPGCDYRCITKSKLTRHRRKHTGERNYPCDWPDCGKAFSTSRHQKEHRRTHTGEKPFKCDYPGCDKWFARKDHIKNHRFTHTGEKPRKCPYPGCEAAFIQLSPLKKHMELHKRDNGPVPNRTRKRKLLAASTNDEDPKRTITECNNNNVVSQPNVTDKGTSNSNLIISTGNHHPIPIQLDALTLEMVASQVITSQQHQLSHQQTNQQAHHQSQHQLHHQHSQPPQTQPHQPQQHQTYNMLPLPQGQGSQNVCPTTGYMNNVHQNNIEYEVMFRSPTYF